MCVKIHTFLFRFCFWNWPKHFLLKKKEVKDLVIINGRKPMHLCCFCSLFEEEYEQLKAMLKNYFLGIDSVAEYDSDVANDDDDVINIWFIFLYESLLH